MNDTLPRADVRSAFERPSDPATASSSASTSLDHLSLLVVRGADAAAFLDSQLTRNVPPAVASGSVGAASLAGYCSPKGRLLASFVMWADTEAIGLIVSRDIAPSIAKRLRMYVLRAKVTIEDASASHRLTGLIGAERLPDPAKALLPWQTVATGEQRWIRYPDTDAGARYLAIGPIDASAAADAGAIDARRWRWLDIKAALPRITTATQDRFVPQMLNLEALGAVDFRKGCFPGQEVVARSQYLGKLKRRMTLASSAASSPLPDPGTDAWVAGDSEPRGMVVDAERGPDGRIALLVELPLAAFASNDLRIGSADGPSLVVEPLPYELPDNEVFVRPKL